MSSNHLKIEIAKYHLDILANELTVVVGIHEHLSNAKDSSSKIQENVANAPSKGAFASKIVIGLRYVFDYCDEKLDVRAIIEEIQIKHHFGQSQNETNAQECSDECKNAFAIFRHSLTASLKRRSTF